MKYAAYGLMAAFLALGVYGAMPDSAEGWYTPDTFAVVNRSADVVFYDEYGEPSWFSVTVDETGKILYGNSDFDTLGVIYPAYAAMIRALTAEALALRNKERIETIGKNLHNLGLADGIDIVGTDPNGNEHRYTMRFTPGSGIRDSLDDGSRPELTDPTAGWNMADEKTLHWRTDNKMELMGADTATSSTDEWWDDYDFFVPFLKGSGALGWKRYGGWYPQVFGTASCNGSTVLTLSGWSDGSRECGTDMHTILTGESDADRADHYVLTRYGTGDGAEFHYVPFGEKLKFGAPVDDVSITTNTAHGAEAQGVASLYGWSNASSGALPSKRDGHLDWASCDDVSFALATVGNGKKYEVKGAHLYAGKHSKHYFGTSNDKSATLGWHELPNVTTNRVEGDERTISSDPAIPGVAPVEGLKRLGLRGWNYGWGGDPLFVVNLGGAVDYIPLPALTNLAACACTNKWEALLDWIEDGEQEEDDISFSDGSLDEYLYGTLGYIYSTEPENLYFDNSGENIQASFSPPENWADGKSIDLTDDGEHYQIKGFDEASACEATISAMLKNPEKTDAQTHLLLAKKTNSGELHYVAMGDGVGGAPVDDVSITTNTAHGAKVQGVASLYGWSSAEDKTVPMKSAGSLVWAKAGGAPVDDVSITTNTAHGAVIADTCSLYGFGNAPAGTQPFVRNDGGGTFLAWGAPGNFGLIANKNGEGWTYTVFGGYYVEARKYYHVYNGITVTSTGNVYLKVPLGTGAATVEFTAGSVPLSDSSYTYIPLYYVDTSQGIQDMRGAPHIQVWE